MSHPNPLINQAMRQGVSCLRRGDTITAHDCFTECVRLDPAYPEAHNKLAAMYHKVVTAATHFPSHPLSLCHITPTHPPSNPL